MFTVRRDIANPFVTPDIDTPWESVAAFNPSPVRVGKIKHAVYRAAGDLDYYEGFEHFEMSTIAVATDSGDGTYTDPRQLIVPEHDWEKFGCEDPRVTYFEGVYYIFYTALGKYPFEPDGIRVEPVTDRRGADAIARLAGGEVDDLRREREQHRRPARLRQSSART